ncbi:MAG: hypothetical protein IJW88_06485 [Alistipes sp.]|nr:hypothetical protein [Alistipes sp.]
MLNIFHIFVSTKENNYEGSTWTISLRTASLTLGSWVWTSVDERGAEGTFVKDFCSKEQAREYVWQMNGWGKPSKKLN